MVVSELIILALLALPIQTGECSYYTRESCRAEGTSGITASGEPLDDAACTAASWFYPFGTVLRVYCWETDRVVYVLVTDRGPNWRLVRQGRILDLSLRAAERLRMRRLGVVSVSIWVMGRKP